MGTALLRPHAGGVVPNKVSYAGASNEGDAGASALASTLAKNRDVGF